MPAYRVLHLSDLHIGNTYLPSDQLAYKISLDIMEKGFQGIQKVLITGDIFNGPSGYITSLVQEASGFFTILMDELNKTGGGKLTQEDFLFVPGNHDIVWSDDLEKRWAKYRDFLEKFYGKIPDFYDPNDFSFTVSCPDERLVFFGFNSCGLEKRSSCDEAVKYCEMIDEKEYKSWGIDKNKLLDLLLTEKRQERYEDFGEILLQQFSKQKRKADLLEGYMGIALFHHHFFLFPDVAKGVADTDVIRNHSTVVRLLRSMGVKTILHGHKHFDWERPFVDENYYSTTDSIIDVFAGGSIGFKDLQDHTFSIFDFYPPQETIKLKQNKFVCREDALDIKSIQIPPAYTQAQAIKLLELMESHDHNSCEKFQEIIMSNIRLHQTCESIISWIGNVLMGYAVTFRYLNRDSMYLICLLCAITGRTIAYIGQQNQEERKKLVITQERLFQFFSDKINADQVTEYRKLFELKNLYQVAKYCNRLLEKAKTPQHRRQIAFVVVGIFFADLNLVLREYSDEFYKQISHKANIKLVPSSFHQYVPAARIELLADPDRRSAYVKMWCSDATAHKLAVLFVKEFDLIINKFEDFFKLIDLKLYYLLPKIEKDAMHDALDNYNFEAYIPTLLPLLIGDKIYHSKTVFARELIQNSIDAISVREAIEKRQLNNKEKTIYIELGQDENNRRFFKIRDHGTGMDRYKVERYFTSIGRSFYSGNDYDDLHIGYKPISSFGIGFLSSFMVCSEVDVRTRSFDGEGEGLKLHIPNYEGCFFIERDNWNVAGTEIKLYLNDSITDEDIIQYISRSMLDIRYNIAITAKKKQLLPAHRVRQEQMPGSIPFFVPFSEDGSIGRPNWERDVLSGNIINNSEYGLLIYMIPVEDGYKKGDIAILNDGIYTDIQSIFALLGEDLNTFSDVNNFLRSGYTLNQFVFNLPSNWIQLDVSREKIVSYSDWMKKQFNGIEIPLLIRSEIASALNEQVKSYLDFVLKKDSNMSAISLDEIFRFLYCLNPKNSIRSLVDRYSLDIIFKESGIGYCIYYNPEKTSVNIVDQGEGAQKSAYSAYERYVIGSESSESPETVKIMARTKGQVLFDHGIRQLRNSMHYKRIPKERMRQRQQGNDNEYELQKKKEFASIALCTLIDRYNSIILSGRKQEWESSLKWAILRHISVEEAERGIEGVFIPYRDIMILDLRLSNIL